MDVMTDPIWTGPAVALVTLFDDAGGLLVEPTAAHAALLVGAGIRAVVVAGSTGEAAALSDTERADLVTAVKAACPDVPVLCGATGEWWEHAAARTATVVKAGADAVLVAPPRLGGALDRYYGRVAEAAGGVPVLAYHYPKVAGGEVPVEALPSLPVAGVKDSSADAVRLSHEVDQGAGAVYTGAAALLGYANWIGATGAIVAAANLVPEKCLAAWAGDADAQREVTRTERIYRGQPGGLKGALAATFGTSPFKRLG
jgi:4-hydroxy-tetrahydrodipicolinate synthase